MLITAIISRDVLFINVHDDNEFVTAFLRSRTKYLYNHKIPAALMDKLSRVKEGCGFGTKSRASPEAAAVPGAHDDPAWCCLSAMLLFSIVARTPGARAT